MRRRRAARTGPRQRRRRAGGARAAAAPGQWAADLELWGGRISGCAGLDDSWAPRERPFGLGRSSPRGFSRCGSRDDAH
jgi:hypothetical protein